jgi:phosphoribosylglycinamide formyltransferase-1
LVIADRKSAAGLRRAEAAGIKTALVPRKRQEELTRVLADHAVDRVITAGYLSILPKSAVEAYRGRIINIHPSLVPLFSGMGFYGLKVHEAVLASGMKVTGATVHFVDEGVDTGKIIGQRAVPVLPGDTAESLRDRVLETEHALLVNAVREWTEK